MFDGTSFERGLLPHGFQVRFAETDSFRTAFVQPPVSPGYRSPLIDLDFRSGRIRFRIPVRTLFICTCPAEAVAIPTRKSARAGRFSTFRFS